MQEIKAIHSPIDPILGDRPPVVHAVEVARAENDLNEVTNALVRLFRKFDLPNGGTLTIEGYGKRLRWDHGDFLAPLARKLLTID
jgi:hypothetical protein